MNKQVGKIKQQQQENFTGITTKQKSAKIETNAGKK